MRIGVYHNLPPGGAHRVLCEQLQRLGKDVAEVYTLSGAMDVSASTDAPVRVYPFDLRRPLESPFGRLNGGISIINLRRMRSVCRRIANDMDSRRFDVVMVHPCSFSQSSPVLEFLKTPSVYYCQEPFRALHEAMQKGGVFTPADDPLRSLWNRYAMASESRALNAASRVLCNSAFTREFVLRSYGVNSTVSYPGIEVDVFRPMDLPRERLALSIGRLSPLKAHDFIVDALARVDAQVRPTLGVVASDDPVGMQMLKERADGQGVKLEFYESVSDERLAELYNRASLTLVASVLEPLGLIPLESMACATPVVAVAEGGLRETVIDGVTGLLSGRDVGEFAGCVETLLADEDLAAKMGQNGRQVVLEKWTWERSVQQLTSVLRACAGEIA